jgi:hypothetical protein
MPLLPPIEEPEPPATTPPPGGAKPELPVEVDGPT